MTGERSEVRDGMRIDWDVGIRMDDELVLRADVFRPVSAPSDGGAPVQFPQRAARLRALYPRRPARSPARAIRRSYDAAHCTPLSSAISSDARPFRKMTSSISRKVSMPISSSLVSLRCRTLSSSSSRSTGCVGTADRRVVEQQRRGSTSNGVGTQRLRGNEQMTVREMAHSGHLTPAISAPDDTGIGLAARQRRYTSAGDSVQSTARQAAIRRHCHGLSEQFIQLSLSIGADPVSCGCCEAAVSRHLATSKDSHR